MRLTQRELADRIGVGRRTVTTWESLGSRPLPGTAEGRLNAVFGPPDTGPPRALSDVSDLELIAELARRLGLPRVGTNASQRVEKTAAARVDRGGLSFRCIGPGDRGATDEWDIGG